MLSHVRLFVTPWAAAHQASPSSTILQSLPKLMSIEAVMSSNHLILSCPLLLPSLFPSIRVFSNQWALHIRWPKYRSFNILPMNIQGSFPLGLTGWISLLSEGLSRLFSSTSSKAGNLQCSAFFMDQLSHPYMTTGKTVTVTIWTFVCKVMSLLFNVLTSLS